MADRDAFDTATRIAAGDDGTNYDNVAISLHWATALLVIVQFVLAITWDYFSRDMRENLQSVHISLGVLLTAVILARIVWRLMPGHQRSAIVSGWVKLASKAVHYLLYACWSSKQRSASPGAGRRATAWVSSACSRLPVLMPSWRGRRGI